MHQNKLIITQTQKSYDNFATWTVESQEITIEENSNDCPEIITPTPPIYDWDTGYTCFGYDRYIFSSQTVSYDNGVSKRPTGIEYTYFVEANSSECGFIPDINPQYQWANGETCVGYDKYETIVQKISYDGGATWAETGVFLLKLDGRGNPILIQKNSKDCGYDKIDGNKYRWTEGEYKCGNWEELGENNYNRYFIKKQQVSYDSGATWSDTGVIDKQLVEVDSAICGYKEPITKWFIVGDCFCDNCDRYKTEVLKTCTPTTACTCDEDRCWSEPEDERTVLVRENSPMCYNPEDKDFKFSYQAWIISEPLEPLEPEPPTEPNRDDYKSDEEYQAALTQYVADLNNYNNEIHPQWEREHNYWKEEHPKWWKKHPEWWKEYGEYEELDEGYNTWMGAISGYSIWSGESRSLDDRERHTVNGNLYPSTACEAYILAYEKWEKEEPEDKESPEHSAWEGNEPPYTVCCGVLPDNVWEYYEGCCESDDCNCSLTVESGQEIMEFSGGTVSFAVGNSDCGYYAYEKEYKYDPINENWKPTGKIRHPDTKEIGERKVIEEESPICCPVPEGQLTRWVVSGTTCDGVNLYNNEVKEVSYGDYDEDDNLIWHISNPIETRLGGLIQENSTECGYVCTVTLKTNATSVKFYNPETTPKTLLGTITVVDGIAAYSTSVTTRYLVAEPSRVGYIFNPSTINIWCGEMKELNGEVASRWTADTGCCEVVKETCNCSLTIQSGSDMMDYNGGTVTFKLGSADCNLYEFEREEIQDEHGEWIPTGKIRNVRIKQAGSSVCCP